MTQWEAYDGAWHINTTLSPQKYYAKAELLPAIGNNDRWQVNVYVNGLTPIHLHESAEVGAYIAEALKH